MSYLCLKVPVCQQVSVIELESFRVSGLQLVAANEYARGAKIIFLCH